MKRIAILINLLIIFTGLKGQTFSWAQDMGSSSYDASNSIAVDSAGNVYTTGYFMSTADFDPGTGTYNLSSNGTRDIFISKIDAAGNFVWAESIGSTGYDIGYGISTDATGNVYISGFFSDTVDFDPGAGVYNMASAGGRDIFVCKLDPLGNLIWAKRMGGTSSEESSSIVLDANGNIYTTGYFQGTADFDPGTGIANLTSIIAWDAFICKLDNSGNYVWAKSFGCTNYEQGLSIATDATGNVYTTGNFKGTTDFDPGTGTLNIVSSGSNDVFISKLDAAGNFVWAKTFGGTGQDYGKGIQIDTSGNIILSGFFQATVDFDPGTDTFNIVSSGNYASFISKLDAAGNFIWAKSFQGNNGNNQVRNNDLAIDLQGNIYTTGYFQGVADFDPGSGNYYLSATAHVNIYVSKLDATGNFIWATSTGQYFDNRAFGIAVDNDQSVYTTGSFSDSADFDPGVNVHMLQAAGLLDIFILKYINCGNMSLSTSQSNVACFGDSSGTITASVSGGTSPYSYLWSNGESSQQATGLSAGTYTVTVTDLNGCQETSSVSITEQNILIADAGMDSNICAGNSISLGASPAASGGASGYTYNWTPGTDIDSTNIANPTATLTSSTSFILTITDSLGCSMSDTITIHVWPLPIVNLAQSGDTLLATGGFMQYEWYLNGILDTTTNSGQLITSNQGNWQLWVTDSNGCSDSSNLITISGIKSNLIQKITLYPNPANEQLYYNIGTSPALINIKLYDLSGKMIASYQKTKPNGKLDVSNIPEGMYLLIFRDATSIRSVPLVIE